MMRYAGLVVMALIMAVTPLAQSADTRPMEEMLGSESLAFWRCDIKKVIESESSYSRLYRDPAIQEFMKKPLSFLEEQSKKATAALAAGENSDALAGMNLESLKAIFSGQILLGLEEPKGKLLESPDDLSLVFIAEIGDSKLLKEILSHVLKSLADEIEVKTQTESGYDIVGIFPKKVSESASRSERNPVNYVITEKHFIAAQRLSSLKALITTSKEGRSDNITTSANFQNAGKVATPSAEMLFFVDMEKLLKAIPVAPVAVVAADENPQAGNAPPPPSREAILAALGLAQLKSLSAWAKASPNGDVDQGLFMHCPGEKTGIVQLLCKRPAEMDLPPFLPGGTLLYEALRVSPNDIFMTYGEIANKFNPISTAMIDMMLTSIKDQHGIDIKEDLLGIFSDEMGMGIILTEEAEQPAALETEGMQQEMMLGMKMSGLLMNTLFFTVTVTDTEKMKTTLETISALAVQMNPMFGGIQAEEVEGQEIFHMVLPEAGLPMAAMPKPTYMLKDGRLFLALNPAPIRAIINQGKVKQALSPLAEKAMGKLSPSPATGLIVMDEGSYLGWYSGILKDILEMSAQQAAAGAGNQAEEEDAELVENGEAKEGGNDAEVKEEAKPAEEAEADKGEEPVAGEEGEEPNLPQAMDINALIDFTLWPEASLFKKYLGYSAARMIPREDGILMQTVSIPATENETSNKK